jgi:hypothetical protein
MPSFVITQYHYQWKIARHELLFSILCSMDRPRTTHTQSDRPESKTDGPPAGRQPTAPSASPRISAPVHRPFQLHDAAGADLLQR